MRRPSWSLASNGEEVILSFDRSAGREVRLTATSIDGLLSSLGTLRETMTPEVATWLMLEQKARHVDEPRCFFDSDALEGWVTMHLRDPRFGWLHYRFSRARSAQLAVKLVSASQAA